MPLTTVDSIVINTGDGETPITGNTVINHQTIIVDFVGNIPLRWNTIGWIYREVEIDNSWVIVNSQRFIPNKPNQFTWSDSFPYRLSFRLVSQIRPGEIIVYAYAENAVEDLSPVAYSGSYNDLTDKPVASQSTAIEPINPAIGQVWDELLTDGYSVKRWNWSGSVWVGNFQSAQFPSTGGGSNINFLQASGSRFIQLPFKRCLAISLTYSSVVSVGVDQNNRWDFTTGFGWQQTGQVIVNTGNFAINSQVIRDVSSIELSGINSEDKQNCFYLLFNKVSNAPALTWGGSATFQEVRS